MPAKRKTKTRAKAKGTLTGKVRAHDPFELIRWLAISQPDPRKAVAELVQNSLDAGARHIRITRVRTRGVPTLRIHDDGEGVIPELGRDEALHYVATHIGHSRKRSLSPQERLQLLTQGQYGIGLLGFWSVGEQLEMRTALPGASPRRLLLRRDSPDFTIEGIRGRLDLDGRWTEVIVAGVHPEALPLLSGRRAADYLAAELRGQLLARDVELLVEDKMARGRAPKLVRVEPRRFLGERLEGLGPIEVPGHPPIRLELYLATETDGESAGPGVYAAGTLVAESFRELANLGLDHPPWTDTRISGLVDFPAFRVTPGSRRGVLLDTAAGVFARAIETVAPALEALLERLEREREITADRTLIRDLQRAFRDFYRRQPHYAMLPVATSDAGEGPEGGTSSGAAIADHGGPPEPPPSEDRASPGGEAPPADLLPAGPLHGVALSPSPVRVACNTSQRIRARAHDLAGRAILHGVQFEWTLEGRVGTLEGAEAGADTATLHAADLPDSGAVHVIARQGLLEVHAERSVIVLEQIDAARSDEGIPTPEFVHRPGASWRSRMLAGCWQVNSGHRDYRDSVERPALRLRYLAMLFAKEVVLRSHQDPRLEAPLEQLVEVTGYADRNLASGRTSTRATRRAGVQARDGGEDSTT